MGRIVSHLTSKYASIHEEVRKNNEMKQSAINWLINRTFLNV